MPDACCVYGQQVLLSHRCRAHGGWQYDARRHERGRTECQGPEPTARDGRRLDRPAEPLRLGGARLDRCQLETRTGLPGEPAVDAAGSEELHAATRHSKRRAPRGHRQPAGQTCGDSRGCLAGRASQRTCATAAGGRGEQHHHCCQAALHSPSIRAGTAPAVAGGRDGLFPRHGVRELAEARGGLALQVPQPEAIHPSGGHPGSGHPGSDHPGGEQGQVGACPGAPVCAYEGPAEAQVMLAAMPSAI
mmetsp:Transcript_57243/g.177927  ORF Transcript_57243/g.177927 Transcript_57243/m.177927 type:complete len:247 (+) Transcript_57243:235-975(+)